MSNCEPTVNYQAINFTEKLNLFSEYWAPKVIAEMNDYQFKIVKIKGDFIFHTHQDTDETFIVLEGSLRIDFEDGYITVAAGEMYVVPKGVVHKPYAEHEVRMVLVEPKNTLNTDDGAVSDQTATNDIWI
ncbi:cupin domain-containing protein [Shewanella sp. VB17]|uniref:cupin domain-containing protein n=1 Tax=Shewanella sp. VB17 TaxID=2739432 RepID=UPI0015657529|nr:cupin domain-containing protein [Shewanella sp. VB17]NRD75808.1 cupin domain-containing protein [Shewanella sp. VB17]